MRISKDRQDARVRVAKTQVLIAEAIEKADEEMDGLTLAEVVLALTQMGMRYHELIFQAETPTPLSEEN